MLTVKMKRINSYIFSRVWFVSLLVAVSLTSIVEAKRDDWQQQDVDWRLSGGSRIKAIRYPEQKKPVLFKEDSGNSPRILRKRIRPKAMRSNYSSFGLLSLQPVTVNVIESPPVAGFVPWIAVAVTDNRSDDIDWVAQVHTSVVGRYLTGSPETDFTIGLFDTGASAHVMGYAGANRTGIYAADLLTPNLIQVTGATGSVFARVSQPLAIFMDGLAAVDPNGTNVDDSNMVGQGNISIVVGQEPLPDQPDLPTAIGSPMSVNFVTAINNDRSITVKYDDDEYSAPDIHFYEHGDSRIPEYNNSIPLNLIPAGAFYVSYIIDYEALINDLIYQPGSPSVIVGNLSQSLFFIDSVDLQEGSYSSLDKDRFMLDTGAQITVISSGIGSRLGLNPTNPDFEVDVVDVTGEVTFRPGFYIDSLEIPALGDWLSFKNVPVVLLDVSSPEGGTLNGIIGMNLFVDFNLVLRGGGLFGQDPPSLQYEAISTRLIADIAPKGGDGVVNLRDFSAFAQAWLTTTGSLNWNPEADIAPQPTSDGVVNFLDLAVFARYWLNTSQP